MRTIAHRLSPTILATLVGGQKPNGYRPRRRKRGVCDTITSADVQRAFKERDVRIMPKTAKGLFDRIMDGEKVAWRGIKIHADRRRNNLFTYRI